MRSLFLFALAGCSFGGAGSPLDAVVSDAMIDGSADALPDAAPRWCDAAEALALCFSFDQALDATVANEGSAAVDLEVTAATQAAGAEGNAVVLGETSMLYIPPTPAVSGVYTVEVWFRMDSPPATNGARFGLVDSNVSPDNVSLFLYRAEPAYQLRCGMGNAVEVFDGAELPTSTWLHTACTCGEGVMKVFVNGVKIGERPAACDTGGSFAAAGLTIGADNVGSATMVGDRLPGAIDGVRMWTVPRSEADLRAAAGTR